MLTAEKPNQVSLKPEDFDPPLKRKEATVPYYWTMDEIANELGCSTRKVTYDITGRPQRNRPAILKAFKIGTAFLVPEEEALLYIQSQRRL